MKRSRYGEYTACSGSADNRSCAPEWECWCDDDGDSGHSCANGGFDGCSCTSWGGCPGQHNGPGVLTVGWRSIAQSVATATVPLHAAESSVPPQLGDALGKLSSRLPGAALYSTMSGGECQADSVSSLTVAAAASTASEPPLCSWRQLQTPAQVSAPTSCVLKTLANAFEATQVFTQCSAQQHCRPYGAAAGPGPGACWIRCALEVAVGTDNNPNPGSGEGMTAKQLEGLWSAAFEKCAQ